MENKDIVHKWFTIWENGDFRNIPVADDFTHTSPFGTIDGKKAYLDVVEANQDAFLGGKFDIQGEIYDGDEACVRYTIKNGDNAMDVCEWFVLGKNEIKSIISYYNIGKVSYEDDLRSPN